MTHAQSINGLPVEERELIEGFVLSCLMGKDPKNALVAVAHAVAAIPWGEGRTIGEVLRTKKAGTCTGKHLVLQACLRKLGIEYRPVVCTFRWQDQGIGFPPSLNGMLSENSWDHGHNFVQVKSNNGDWIDLDITWDKALNSFGFKTLPASWNGASSFLGVKIIKRWDGVEMAEKKEELIRNLSPKQHKARELFLQAFIDWIAGLR